MKDLLDVGNEERGQWVALPAQERGGGCADLFEVERKKS